MNECCFSPSSRRNLIPTFLNTIYAHDPAASLLNLDTKTLKFANPLSVFYVDSPSKELVDQIVQGAGRLTASQVPEFVGLAATVLKAYKARETNNKNADNVCIRPSFSIAIPRVRFFIFRNFESFTELLQIS